MAFSGVHVVLLAPTSWWPPTSSEAAVWVQAFGVIGSLFFSGWVLQRQLRDRDEDRDRESRRGPSRITGWVERPTRERDPSTGLDQCWRVTGTVINRSDTEVWDVHVRLLDQQGRTIPTPTLVRTVLAPGAEWRVWWTVGHRFKPYCPGGGEQDASPLPMPRAITDPAARQRLEVTFTDFVGGRWRRETSRLDRVTGSATDGPANVPGSSLGFSRALEILDCRSTAQGLDEHLLTALNEAARELFGAIYRPSTSDMAAGLQMEANHVLSNLEEDSARWLIGPGYTEQLNGIHVISGAVNQVTKRLSVNDVDQLVSLVESGDVTGDVTRQVCSILTALGGLTHAG
jgi:hypothetical protein